MKIEEQMPELKPNNGQMPMELPSAPLAANPLLSDAKFVPFFFSTLMVKSLIKGTKIKTRRIVDIQDHSLDYMGVVTGWEKKNGTIAFGKKEHKEICQIIKPKAKIGDVIWVRETFNTNYNNTGFIYKADFENPAKNKQFWKPSLFMTKKACRLFLKIIDVKIERLKNISEEDAEFEGVNVIDYNCYENYMVNKDWFYNSMNQKSFHMIEDPIGSFASLWTKINGLDSWGKNPYVWVYTFKIVECPLGFR